jgi:hypothetical protein
MLQNAQRQHGADISDRVSVGTLLQLLTVMAAVLTCPGTARLSAQTVYFETASVKTNRSGDDGMSAGRRGSRYTAINAPLKFLIFSALNIGFEPSRLIGGPESRPAQRVQATGSRWGRIPSGI